ncbi:BREX-1 system adenine-specific DNA-methyltransferase PglX [Priestia koreensis]|uniref:BREX-1 system adenine-specific DNA-methyltransferase PglX n=1 Tax=Priestia koreensis TaxID=284581 RepID=UPI00203AFF61|nr:BREX-1 system adenine-specific DNA-methyltransferase PglX [Priestia koreensis]MCM3003550.1 BREX-1 system adenine-specific DNA-methyltransferase PglX [Priestia koreensis]
MSENTKTQSSEETELQTNDQTVAKEKGSSNYVVNLTLLGGVVGAGIGLMSNPGMGKKISERVGKSDVMKLAGKELKKTMQELIAGQAADSLKKTAVDYITKKVEGVQQGNAEEPKQTASASSGESYEKLQEENKQLNDQLKRLEEKLNKVLESK